MTHPLLRSALAGAFSVTLLSGCAVDKAHHAAAGAGISILVTEITGSPLKGCAAALAAGLAKEAWDSTGRGHVEAADVAATVLGCGVTWRF